MQVSKEKSKLKAAELQMKMLREDAVLDLKNLEGNPVIDQLEENMMLRETPIINRSRKRLVKE